MHKQVMKVLGLGALVVLVAGCTGSVGVSARSYVEDKPRVDQAMEDGNKGYLSGTPVTPDRSNLSTTRKMYVLEVTKEIPDETGDILVPPRRSSPQGSSSGAEMNIREDRPIEIPSFDEGSKQVESAGEAAFEEYKVETGDTLQKISKKFYDTYKKWQKIYDANKEAIKDPNRIKPGTTLRIPKE